MKRALILILALLLSTICVYSAMADQISATWTVPAGPQATLDYIRQNNIQIVYQLYVTGSKEAEPSWSNPVYQGARPSFSESRTEPGIYCYSVRGIYRRTDGGYIYGHMSNVECHEVREVPVVQPPASGGTVSQQLDSPGLKINVQPD